MRVLSMSEHHVKAPSGGPGWLTEVLEKRGFVRRGGRLQRRALTFEWHGRWGVFAQRVRSSSVHKRGGRLGNPGLWKLGEKAGAPVLYFEVPMWLVSRPGGQADSVAGDGFSLGVWLDWALATRRGQTPEGWASPPAEEAQAWLPEGALTFQARGQVCQAELILNGRRWAVRLPVVARVPDNLPRERLAALDKLARLAQRQWRLVRVGMLHDETARALVAEVDLTGGPHDEFLLSTAAEALRHVWARVVETAEVLADPVIEIAPALLGYPQDAPQKRKDQ